MLAKFAALALAAASIVSAQGVTATLSPTDSAPPGCATDFPSSFEISVALPAKKRDAEKRASCAADGTLVATLTGSVLTDANGRIGGIVANGQFQFDGPPSQAGTIYNAGFSVCSNGSLALGGSTVFYQCRSGSFYNLYDTAAGALCEAVVIQVLPCGGSAGGPAGQASDGQPTVTSAVVQTTDGQVQASSAASQIDDGQVQASSAGPLPVSQFTDGQIQVTATPSPVVSQISDGQVQVTSAPTPISQISDGQIQNSGSPTTATPTPAGNISVTTSGPALVSAALAPIMNSGAQIAIAVAGLALFALL